MTELEVKIIKFLLSSAVYSENAIMKNLGIDKETLDKSFKILEDNSSCSSCSSHSCSSGSSCCDNNIFSDLEDFSKIKVITMKAVDNFS